MGSLLETKRNARILLSHLNDFTPEVSDTLPAFVSLKTTMLAQYLKRPLVVSKGFCTGW